MLKSKASLSHLQGFFAFDVEHFDKNIFHNLPKIQFFSSN